MLHRAGYRYKQSFRSSCLPSYAIVFSFEMNTRHIQLMKHTNFSVSKWDMERNSTMGVNCVKIDQNQAHLYVSHLAKNMKSRVIWKKTRACNWSSMPRRSRKSGIETWQKGSFFFLRTHRRCNSHNSLVRFQSDGLHMCSISRDPFEISLYSEGSIITRLTPMT